jgi:copper transport protein
MRITCLTAARTGLVVLLSAIALTGLAGTASAHAQLEGSDPPSGEVLTSAPQQVTLTFGEPVEVSSGAVQVFDDHLRRVDNEQVSSVDGQRNRIRVTLHNGLGPGTYTVSWRVSSADTHPVSGTFPFSIGAPSQVTGTVPGAGRNDTAGVLLGVLRGVGYAGLVLAPGVLLVVLLLWPAGLADRRTRRLLWTGVSLLGTSTIGGMLLQGVWASGLPLSSIWAAPSTLDTHSRSFDTAFAMRFYLLVAFGVALAAAVLSAPKPVVAHTKRDRRAAARMPERRQVPRRLLLGGAVGCTAALLITWSLAGHAAAGPQPLIAIASDLLHLSAMTVWLGGLAVLAVSLSSKTRASELATVLPRFSRVAFAAVMVLVVTGTYQAWREVGSLAALPATSFGRLLLAKLGGVILLLVLGNFARRWVQRHLTRSPVPAERAVARGAVAVLERDEPQSPQYGPAEIGRLRRGLAAELAIGMSVLALTAALVATVPGRQAYVAPFKQTVSTAGITVRMTIDAPRTGDTVLHVSTSTSDGRPKSVQKINGTLSLPSAGLGPLPVRVDRPDSVSGEQNVGLTFPAQGQWTLRLTVQTSALDSTAVSVTVAVS